MSFTLLELQLVEERAQMTKTCSCMLSAECSVGKVINISDTKQELYFTVLENRKDMKHRKF